MDSTPAGEAILVLKLFGSISHVFKTKGTPDDLNFIMTHLKQAVCHRGVSTSTQSSVVELLAPMSKFKAGLMDVEELFSVVQKASLKIAGPDVVPYIPKVNSIPELKKLAVELHYYSKENTRLSQCKSPSPMSTNSNIPGGRRLVYSRDTLLGLKQPGKLRRHCDIPASVGCGKAKPSQFPWMKSLRQIAVAMGALTPPESPLQLEECPPFADVPAQEVCPMAHTVGAEELDRQSLPTLKIDNQVLVKSESVVVSELTPPTTPIDALDAPLSGATKPHTPSPTKVDSAPVQAPPTKLRIALPKHLPAELQTGPAKSALPTNLHTTTPKSLSVKVQVTPPKSPPTKVPQFTQVTAKLETATKVEITPPKSKVETTPFKSLPTRVETTLPKSPTKVEMTPLESLPTKVETTLPKSSNKVEAAPFISWDTVSPKSTPETIPTPTKPRVDTAPFISWDTVSPKSTPTKVETAPPKSTPTKVETKSPPTKLQTALSKTPTNPPKFTPSKLPSTLSKSSPIFVPKSLEFETGTTPTKPQPPSKFGPFYIDASTNPDIVSESHDLPTNRAMTSHKAPPTSIQELPHTLPKGTCPGRSTLLSRSACRSSGAYFPFDACWTSNAPGTGSSPAPSTELSHDAL